ncbi:DUF6207 family protein [Streptomyces lydicus]|uniref:DUF6207 family protein n=1 Tax=Streptomyces lydicus TaxID=47763 RepID=UPI0037A0B975
MKITEAHVAEPGLVVVEIAAADDETLVQAMAAMDKVWFSSGPSEPYRIPGEPGVRVRAYGDMRRSPDGTAI